MQHHLIGPHSPVEALATRTAPRLPPDACVGEAARTMREADTSALLVGEGVEAIITERDFARALSLGLGPETPVSAVATTSPHWVAGSLPVVDAAAAMLQDGLRHLIILRTDGEVRIVSVREVLEVMLRALDPVVWMTALRLAVSTSAEIWLG